MEEGFNELIKRLAEKIYGDNEKAEYGLEYIFGYYVHEAVMEAAEKHNSNDPVDRTMRIAVDAGDNFVKRVRELGEKC
jgi:hypothetical protein